MDVLERIKYLDKLLEEKSSANIYVMMSNDKVEEECIGIILLRLEKLKRIKLENNEIKVIDNTYNGLSASERFILQRINRGKVIIECYENVIGLACKELLEDKLIKRKYKDLEYLYRIIYIILILITVHYVPKWIDIYLLGFVFIMFTIPIFVGLDILINNVINKNKYILTNTGSAIQENVYNFKEYFVLNKKDFEMWDNYEIYSAILNVELSDKLKAYMNCIENKKKLLDEKNK